MKYQLDHSNYQTFAIYERNKLPPRSYFIPYPDRAAADRVGPLDKRYASPKVLCLNGSWDFQFYPRPGEMPDVLDTNQIPFDTIDVPSCWQFRGYDRPFYVNIRYQFPYNPPKIPTTEKVGRVFSWTGVDQGLSLRWKDPGEEYNFVGVYRRFLDIEDPGKRYVISFLGVASCMDLYLNGGFVGYSEGSHNTAEFDLTGKLRAGENELVVVVHRWCTGTYLECQDMFRNNGIFRDVLLYGLPRLHVRDLFVKAELEREYRDGHLTVELDGEVREPLYPDPDCPDPVRYGGHLHPGGARPFQDRHRPDQRSDGPGRLPRSGGHGVERGEPRPLQRLRGDGLRMRQGAPGLPHCGDPRRPFPHQRQESEAQGGQPP